MKWTPHPPTESGWYWTRRKIDQTPIVRHVVNGKVNTGHLLIDAAAFDCEWYGPLKVPR